jgi:hypothetical protein
MNSNNRINESNNRTKAIATIPMARAIVIAALLLSGLCFISSYQPAIAQQQNMTGGNATMAGGGNATNATMAGGGNATNATMAGGGNATNATMGATTTTTGGPTAGQGEGSGGGAAGGGGTTPSQ